MSDKKTCPLLRAGVMGGLLGKYLPWELESNKDLREAVPLSVCLRNGCELWRNGSGCGLVWFPETGIEELKDRGAAE